MTSSRRTRLTGSTLLAAAVGLVVVLDTGVVPLPFSTPRPATAGGVVGAGSGGAGPTPTPTQPPEVRARDAAITRTLDAVTDAVRTGSPTAPLVARGESATARALKRFVENVRAVPGATAAVVWDRSVAEAVPLADGEVSLEIGVTSRVVAADPAAYDGVSVRLRRAGERWLLSAWEPVGGQAAQVPQTPFLLPLDVTGVRRPHVLVLGSPRNGRLNERLATRAESAALRSRQVFPQPGWDGTAVVYAFTDTAFLDVAFGRGQAGPRDPYPYYWWTKDLYEMDARRTVVRVVLGSGYVLADGRDARSGLRQAIGYRAALATADGEVPAWLVDGMAEYVTTRTSAEVDADAALEERGLGDATWATMRRGTWKPRLLREWPGDETATESSLAADSAWLACVYAADRYGEKRLQAAWDASAAAPGGLLSHEEAAFEALGTTRKAFVAGLTTWGRRLVARSG